MAKIYLPSEYINNCNVVNQNYIRSYINDNRTEWVDIYINQDYQLKRGYSTYGNNVVCDFINTYTDNFYYRLDFSNILIDFFIISLVGILLPVKIFSKIFRKGVL